MQQRIVLHLGVHKTATTYIQSRLEQNIEQLNAQGIAYVPLLEFRQQITRHLNDDSFDRHTVAEVLKPFSSFSTLILSDENILGSARPHDGLLYSGYLPRVRKVVNACYGKKLEVHITLRNYHDFLVSRYSEILRHRSFISFDHYIEKLNIDKISWVYIIEDLLSLNFINKIHITLFEELFSHENAYFNALAGVSIDLTELDKNTQATRRSKISSECYDILLQVNAHYGAVAAKEVMSIIDIKEQRTNITPFSPLSAETKQMLTEKYLADIELMKQNFTDRVVIK